MVLLLSYYKMGTRAAAFTAKIKNLNEIQMRLMQGSVPLPQVRFLKIKSILVCNTIHYVINSYTIKYTFDLIEIGT